MWLLRGDERVAAECIAKSIGDIMVISLFSIGAKDAHCEQPEERLKRR